MKTSRRCVSLPSRSISSMDTWWTGSWSKKTLPVPVQNCRVSWKGWSERRSGYLSAGSGLKPNNLQSVYRSSPTKRRPPSCIQAQPDSKMETSQRIPQFSSRFAAESLSSWYHRWIKVYLSESLEEQLEIKLSIWNCRFCSLLQLYQPNNLNIFCRKLVNQTTYYSTSTFFFSL